MAHLGAFARIDVERLEPYARFFAELYQRQAEVYIHRQFRVGDVVENAACIVSIGRFAKLPGEFLVTFGITDRARQRNPAAARYLEHDESVAFADGTENRLSPSSATFAIVRVDAATISLTRAISSSVGVGASSGAGRNRRARPNVVNITAATRLARNMRGASAFNSNCHHNAFEYSTCRYANRPSMTLPAITIPKLSIHPTVNGWSSSFAPR